MPSTLLKVIAECCNRIETTFAEITDRMELAHHGARTFHGLFTRAEATIAAHPSYSSLSPRHKPTHITGLRASSSRGAVVMSHSSASLPSAWDRPALLSARRSQVAAWRR
jgi:hypothetical protein